MDSLKIQNKMYVNHVKMVVKPVMIKNMINAHLVNLILILLYTSNNMVKISVFYHVQKDNMDKI